MGERSPVHVIRSAAAVLALLAVLVVLSLLLLGGQVSQSFGPAPRMIYESPTMGGYWDVACSTTTPGGDPAACSTPLPSLQPSAVAQASPLEIPALDVPVAKTGLMRVDLGQATIANGVLQDASFHLAGINPGVQILPAGLDVAGTIRLEVQPTDPSRPPFSNGYMRGWRPGVETVHASLVLDVTRFDPGTVLQIRDVIVR